MTPERWLQIKEIFYAAQERDGAERDSFLTEACAGDDELKREIESLLVSFEKSESFIEAPAFEVAPLAAAAQQKVGQRIGPYKLLEEIGRGGMGTVYLAERDDAEFRQRVALKLIRAGLDTEDILQRFRNERQILASLNHPNIARLLDGGSTPEGLPYFVLEYVEGQPLIRYCDDHQLSTLERLKLFRKVCDAVSYAHRNLVIHRDLKPSNILVTNEGEPKLLDFGIAKFLSPDLVDQPPTQTATGLRIMTPEYASPEQVQGLRVTTATDIYSLGVVLFELLTGHWPYRQASRRADQLARAICEEQPERPSNAIAGSRLQGAESKAHPQSVIRDSKSLRGDLDNIVLMALRKEPQRRYSSVDQFSEDVRRHLAGLPVLAREDSFGYRASKFITRHKAGVAAALLVLLSLVGGLVATIYQSRVARAERDRAQLAQAKAERINRFMQEALGAPDPNKDGREVKVIDVLEKAARRAETELADQPEVLAEVQHTIGNTYFNLELYDKGEPLLRSALRIVQEKLGERHPTSADFMRDLSNLLAYQEKFDEAILLLQRTVAIYSSLQPERARDLANAKYSLAQAYYFKGDPKSAEPLYREILEYATRSFGERDSLVAEAANDLANILRDQEYDAAITLYKQAAEIVRPDADKRMNLATCLSNLGVALTNAGRHDEAQGVLQESLTLRRKLFGDQSPSVAIVLVNLSRASFNAGDYPQAETEAREAVEIQKKALPEKHRNFAASYAALGSALSKNGKQAEAEKYLRDGVELYATKYGAEDRSGAIARGALGEWLSLQSHYEEAEPLLKQSYETLQAKLGDRDLVTIEACKRLISLYEKWGKPDAAALYRGRVAVK